jgi:hypothetical protein
MIFCRIKISSYNVLNKKGNSSLLAQADQVVEVLVVQKKIIGDRRA